MTQLTQAQTTLLRRAANTPDGVEVEGSAKTTASRLAKAGLLSGPAADSGSARFQITDTGRMAIGLPVEVPVSEPSAAAGLPGGKLGMIVGLLRRAEGAQIAEMVAATGWQAHSVRGAMSGALKKKLGLTIASQPSQTGRVYRIPVEAA